MRWREFSFEDKRHLAAMLDAEAALVGLGLKTVTPEQVVDFRIGERLAQRERNRLEEIAIVGELQRRKRKS